MALTKCAECGAEISTQAKVCPRCGAKLRRPAGPIGIVVVVGLGLIFLVGQLQKPEAEAKQRRAIAAAEAAKTPEDRKREALAAQREEAAYELTTLIKRAAYDPDSVKYISVKTDKTGDLACAQYRAKNAFGALIIAGAVIKNRTVYQELSDWQRLCRSKGLIDLTFHFSHY